MNKIISSNYELIASTFTTCSIAQPIKMVFSPDTSLMAIWEEFMNYNQMEDWCCLVRDDQHIYGYLSFEDPLWDQHPLEGIARDEVLPIELKTIVPASLPLLELLPLFEKSLFFFILTRNEITHVVTLYDLDKLPFKFSLFSLFMELESQLIELLTIDNSRIEQYLSLLSKQRIVKAKDLCIAKYKEETPYKLLLCTTFIDKKEILIKSPNFNDKLPFESKKKASTFFKKVEFVRNQIAHSDSILEVYRIPSELVKFINELSNLISVIVGLKIEHNKGN
jgi:hypothetical protein